MIERIIVNEPESDPLHLKLQQKLEEKYKVFTSSENVNKRKAYRSSRTFRDLTPEEIDYIKQNYKQKSVAEISRYLSISPNVIYGRIRRGVIIIQ